MVLKRGINEKSILPMARYFHGTDQIVRFIEYMDVGTSNDWRLDDIVPAQEVVATIDAEMPLEPVDPDYRGEVANRYRYKDGGGEISIIASVTQPFCANCTRACISAEGKLYTCLFGAKGHDLRALVRGGFQRRGRGRDRVPLEGSRRPLLGDSLLRDRGACQLSLVVHGPEHRASGEVNDVDVILSKTRDDRERLWPENQQCPSEDGLGPPSGARLIP